MVAGGTGIVRCSYEGWVKMAQKKKYKSGTRLLTYGPSQTYNSNKKLRGMVSVEKNSYNWKSIVVGLGVFIVGILMVVADIFWIRSQTGVWISIGCSLIASALVLLFTTMLIERVPFNPLNEWKIERIFATRAEKNSDSDPELEHIEYCLDGIAFGLRSFRSKQTKRIELCLQRGVNIRLLTMDPNSDFVKQREREENETEGQITHTINELVKWADDLNAKSHKGKIVVKGYKCMTLDFYWRLDDTLYIGPYLYGIPSQQTITFKFNKGGKGFQTYIDYFESLWDNNDLSTVLTKNAEITRRGRKR